MWVLMPPETGNCIESAAKLPVSGGIKMSVLMPPETGNCFESAAKLPVSGYIKIDFLTPPETGNCFESAPYLPLSFQCLMFSMSITCLGQSKCPF